LSSQELDRKDIDELLSKVMLGHLGTLDSESKPYIVPLAYSYVDGAIYLLVRDKGKKIENIRRNPYVCFEVTYQDPPKSIDRSEPRPDSFTSVIAIGKAEKVVDNAEILKVYSERVLERIQKFGSAIYKIKPEEITGKKWIGYK